MEIHAVTPGRHDRVVVTAPLVRDQQILQLTASASHLAWVISDTDRQAEPSPDPNEGCHDTKYHGCALYVMKHGMNQAIRIKLHSFSATPTSHRHCSDGAVPAGTQPNQAGSVADS